MRAMTVILSLYMLLLAVMPCPCAETHEVHGRLTHAAVAEVSAAHGQDVGATDADACSPFCANLCCHHAPVTTAGGTVFDLRSYIHGHSGDVSLYLEPHTYRLYGSLWRPPIAA